MREPVPTLTAGAEHHALIQYHLALVTVWLKGEPWVIVDITLRMLVPRELYNAQDFPPGYVRLRQARDENGPGADGRQLREPAAYAANRLAQLSRGHGLATAPGRLIFPTWPAQRGPS
ncbi:hypothetical protein [Delftia acidovorans]|uniref:hypothetical protein n=1 Tax=Delftia acidovorans TaxID=80866 RepID=UPI003A5BC344